MNSVMNLNAITMTININMKYTGAKNQRKEYSSFSKLSSNLCSKSVSEIILTSNI